MRETWVRFLGWEDPLEKGKATHSSILACRIPWTVCIVHGVTMNVQTWRLSLLGAAAAIVRAQHCRRVWYSILLASDQR